MRPSKRRPCRRKASRSRPSTDFAKSAGGSGCLTAGRRRNWVLPDEGASLIRETLTTYRAIGSVFQVAAFLTWLAEAQALGGAPAETLQTMDEALTLNPDERFWRPETLRVRGEIRRKQGAEELAEADFRGVIALAREMSAKAW